MTDGIVVLAAALAALIGALLLVRLGGQFAAGHALRITKRFVQRLQDDRDGV
ncbi:hypothetical protein [Singulisphaera acidiphila]|uniref:Uncharacterized protein n=1 Tax=Singulisphaera acidiphila (strain ATCC BAA-1392 / DSM 18658 / VKM B-2454 / MOB10) TaxID=886293 RepID=L0DHT2_SINAD|nr:hypothetical protein [Singulisphaera acidiphila]AGA28400.1 hypothetical protein Sinac_4196 [Singulisphaera acidiphila DSM 18658]